MNDKINSDDYNTLYESFDTFLAKVDLFGEKCHLKHAPKHMEFENPPAVDYLCQYFGWGEENVITEQLRIPICEECVYGLYDEDWVLLYCISCNSSQWVYKPYSKMEFHSDVVWLDSCPECYVKEE